MDVHGVQPLAYVKIRWMAIVLAPNIKTVKFYHFTQKHAKKDTNIKIVISISFVILAVMLAVRGVHPPTNVCLKHNNPVVLLAIMANNQKLQLHVQKLKPK
jgi:hypothetical protein